MRSKGKEIGTMTDISFHQDAEVTMTLSKTSTDTEIETEESQDENVRNGNESDFSYRPSDDSGSSEEEGHKKSNFHPVPNSKFIVYWSCLLTLLETCRFCLKPTTIERFFRKGSKIVIEVVCAMKHRFTWESQPNEHGMAAGNISLAASIIPEAITSHFIIPPKMFTKMALTFLSDKIKPKLLATFSFVALPPTSRKFAGEPPWCLIKSMVAMARPAPLTIQPISPDKAM